MSLLDPFATNAKPFVNGAPGVDARKDPGAIKSIPAPHAASGHLGRLAQAISRLPRASSSRGNARDLFLP